MFIVVNQRFPLVNRKWTYYIEIMHSPKTRTNADGFRLVINKLGTKTALAEGLGVVKQLVSRWEEIPVKHLRMTCKLTGLDPSDILPELFREANRSVTDCNHISDHDMLELIRLLVK